jgi:hypothetical protein
LFFEDNFWFIHDLGSTNGIRVNGEFVKQKSLRPGDQISIANRDYTIEYTLPAGQNSLAELIEDNIMDVPLLEKAGLVKPRRDRDRSENQE